MSVEAAERPIARSRIGAPPLPTEHGAWIGLAAAVLVGLIHGGTPDLGALGAGAVAFCFFAAKASAEHLAIGLRPERAGFWLTAFVGAGGLILSALPLPVVAAPAVLVGALGALLAHAAARGAKAHRALVWEALGFFGIGFAATLVLLTKGISLGSAFSVGALLGLHLSATVPFVRLRVRPGAKDRVLTLWAVCAIVAAPVAALALAAAGLGSPWAALAFGPGVAKVLVTVARGAPRTKAKRVGLEETAWTSLFVVLLLALA